MKFAIQYNLMNDTQLQHVADAVKQYPHVFIGVVPFSREITSEQPLEGVDYIPYGSTLLTNLAADLGWTGLHFDVTKLNYRNFTRNRNDMLNGEYIFSAEEAIRFLENGMRGANQMWFTRPSEDLKHYSGYVAKANEIADQLQSMVDSFNRGEQGSYGLNPATEIVLSTPKDISAEWRWFIVGGKIVSGSMYRAHGQLRKLRELDQAVIGEAQALADIWLPCDCVVMDTALVGDDIKVIEFNTINSSGFYDNDVPAVFSALWEYHSKE
jgi:ATP-grasp domain, R2K clade family 3